MESAAPVARLQADEFALQLTQLRISDAFYADLRALPRSSLAPLDAVKLAVHEAEVDLRADNERLRQTLAASRETAARAEEEAARARVQAGRMAAALSERERDLQGLADGMGARVERLAEELQAATVSDSGSVDCWHNIRTCIIGAVTTPEPASGVLSCMHACMHEACRYHMPCKTNDTLFCKCAKLSFSTPRVVISWQHMLCMHT